ncbi:protein of unknown function [Pseudomonas sp. JV241A]|nr:protein of unknown function [Pseudomonas sp. JV241A]
MHKMHNAGAFNRMQTLLCTDMHGQMVAPARLPSAAQAKPCTIARLPLVYNDTASQVFAMSDLSAPPPMVQQYG